MAYEAAYLNVYELLANESIVDPNLLFTVPAADILDFDIEADVFVADEAFDIRGRTATVKTLWQGQFRAWLQAKRPCAIYPEYFEGIIDVVDSETNIILFRGAMQMGDIAHDYDAATVDIRLHDTIDIWITQAKKTFVNVIEPNDEQTAITNDWSINNGHPRTFETLLYMPVRYLQMDLWWFSRSFAQGTYEIIDSMPLDMDTYANDFSSWQPTFGGVYIDVDWEDKYYVVMHSTSTNKFYVNFIHSFDTNVSGNQTWFYRVYKAAFNETNLLQPVLEKYFELQTSQNIRTAQIYLNNLLGEGDLGFYTYIENNHLKVVNHYSAFIYSGSYQYTIAAINDIIYISQPMSFNSLLLSSGKHSYSDITYALFTANALTFGYNNYGSKYIINSGLSTALDFTGGTVISAANIINQKRTGYLASYDRIGSALSICTHSKILINALQYLYSQRLSQIGVKLTFQMPVSYRDAQGLTVRSKIIIDSITYVITAMGFPQDGLVEIECIGEWE